MFMSPNWVQRPSSPNNQRTCSNPLSRASFYFWKNSRHDALMEGGNVELNSPEFEQLGRKWRPVWYYRNHRTMNECCAYRPTQKSAGSRYGTRGRLGLVSCITKPRSSIERPLWAVQGNLYWGPRNIFPRTLTSVPMMVVWAKRLDVKGLGTQSFSTSMSLTRHWRNSLASNLGRAMMLVESSRRWMYLSGRNNLMCSSTPR